jgi:hypothetical protein
LVSNDEFKHSGNNLYGENLAYFQGYGRDTMGLIKKAIDLWYDEIKLYDFKNPGFSHATGHFTCLVWKSSTHFGMGFSINTATNAVDITMNTSQPGNYSGRYEENVLPLMPTPMPSPANSPKSGKKKYVPKHIHVQIPYVMQKYTGKKLLAEEQSSEMSYPDCSLNNYRQVVHLSATPQGPSLNKLLLIRSLYNLLNQVQANYPTVMLINSVNQIIHSVNNMNI